MPAPEPHPLPVAVEEHPLTLIKEVAHGRFLPKKIPANHLARQILPCQMVNTWMLNLQPSAGNKLLLSVTTPTQYL